jgi:hypothetical protein
VHSVIKKNVAIKCLKMRLTLLEESPFASDNLMSLVISGQVVFGAIELYRSAVVQRNDDVSVIVLGDVIRVEENRLRATSQEKGEQWRQDSEEKTMETLSAVIEQDNLVWSASGSADA